MLKKGKLIIWIVWYNEEKNLSKCFESLRNFDGLIAYSIVYIDQMSVDKSVEIAKKYWVEVFVHQNKWYADPDKKWIYNKLVGEQDWFLIIDADEEVSKKLAQEIVLHIKHQKYFVFRCPVRVAFLTRSSWTFYQLRLFKKWFVDIVDTVHEYVRPKTKSIGCLKHILENRDNKDQGRSIFYLLDKINRYTDKELEKRKDCNHFILILKMFLMPIVRFFWWGIKNKLFLEGIPGLIFCRYMATYQFTIYAKMYEKSL